MIFLDKVSFNQLTNILTPDYDKVEYETTR